MKWHRWLWVLVGSFDSTVAVLAVEFSVDLDGGQLGPVRQPLDDRRGDAVAGGIALDQALRQQVPDDGGSCSRVSPVAMPWKARMCAGERPLSPQGWDAM